MKQILVCTVLALGGLVVSPRAVSGPAGEELSKCIIASTNQADRQAFVQWMVGALSLHPSVKTDLGLPDARREAYDLKAAKLFERLLTDSCAAQVRDTVRNEGTKALQTAFEKLGELAAQEAFSDPAVAQGMQNMFGKMDAQRLKQAMTAQP